MKILDTYKEAAGDQKREMLAAIVGTLCFFMQVVLDISLPHFVSGMSDLASLAISILCGIATYVCAAGVIRMRTLLSIGISASWLQPTIIYSVVRVLAYHAH